MPCCESSSEERSARNPHATFCGSRRWVTATGDPVLAGVISPDYPAEAHNGAGSNTVTLPGPKGGSNGEYKADLHTGGILSTRPPAGRQRQKGFCSSYPPPLYYQFMTPGVASPP